MKKKLLTSILVICFTFICLMFAGCAETPNSYQINVNTLHYSRGAVEGGNKEYAEGEEITIKAIPATSNNVEFFCWLLNNKVVSTKAEYTFVVSKQTAGDYLALFTSPYLEYFALDEFTIDSGIDSERNPDIMIKQIDIYFGKIENVTTKILSAKSDTFDNAFTYDNAIIYSDDKMPYGFDIQEDIFIKIELTYVKEDVEYFSSTNTKISSTNNLEQEVIELKDEQKSTQDNTVGIELSNPVNVNNEEQELDIANYPTFSLKLKRLDTFNIVDNVEE